jgi:hypothetical protein
MGWRLGRSLAFALGLACLVVACLLGGCAAVAPWERGDLARRCMTSPPAESGLEEAYWRKVHETRTAGTLITAAAGGGCGCSQ